MFGYCQVDHVFKNILNEMKAMNKRMQENIKDDLDND